jgi:hypothetical protein
VQDQIKAATELGITNWLLWNPDTEYTMDALAPVG